jgi:hypothetical protein
MANIFVTFSHSLTSKRTLNFRNQSSLNWLFFLFLGLAQYQICEIKLTCATLSSEVQHTTLGISQYSFYLVRNGQRTLYAAQATGVVNLELAPALFLFQKV